jgi:ABC-type polysaccharide/polyol phosphate transport system ATPase subunit
VVVSRPTGALERATPAPAGKPPALEIEQLTKTFRIPHQRYSTLKERALHPMRARRFDELHAVDGVSATIEQGEFFGIVGRNGSGKSTLLKCVAGIYEADAGYVAVHGRLSPFIELGVGFNPELTARENVLINAIMLGLTRRQARERFDEIIAFAGLEEFLDLKLKNYSSGMSVRLAFSVAIQVDADVLLVDEVLAVGDAAFQQKCFEEFYRLKDEGRTIVLVTHDMSAVERFCERAMLLERGRMVALDEPHVIARAYNRQNFAGAGQTNDAARGVHAGLPATVEDAWFENDAGERVTSLAQDELLTICMEAAFHEPVEEPVFALHVRSEGRHQVFATSTWQHGARTGDFAPGERATFRARVYNWLAAGRYTLTPTVARHGGADVLDVQEGLASLFVHGGRSSGSVVEFPHELDLQRT